MKSVIHKWAIPFGYTITTVGVFLYADIKDGIVYVWTRADVNESNGEYVSYNVTNHYYVIGTGWEFDPEDTYHQTFYSGNSVWHLIESLTPIER